MSSVSGGSSLSSTTPTSAIPMSTTTTPTTPTTSGTTTRNASTTTTGTTSTPYMWSVPQPKLSTLPDDMWVTVTWMPHSSLSQTSHVVVGITSAHVNYHPPHYDLEMDDTTTTTTSSTASTLLEHEEWRVQVSVHGMAGLDLVSGVTCSTTAGRLVRTMNTASTTKGPYSSNSDGGGGGGAIHPITVPSCGHFTHECRFNTNRGNNKWLPLPIRWRDLPRDSYLRLVVVGSKDVPLYETTLALFDGYGKLRSGLIPLDLYEYGKGSLMGLDDDDDEDPTYNPGLLDAAAVGHGKEKKNGVSNNVEEDPVWEVSCILDTLDYISTNRNSSTRQSPTASGAKEGSAATTSTRGAGSTVASPSVPPPTSNTNRFGEIPSVPWLDAMTRQHCHEVLQLAATAHQSAGPSSPLSLLHQHRARKPRPPILIVELPRFEVPILHEETLYALPTHGACGAVTPLDLAIQTKHGIHQTNREAKEEEEDGDDDDDDDVAMIATTPQYHEWFPWGLDYGDTQDNPVEEKYRALAHDLLRGLVDPALKPDKEQRDRLNTIIASPSHHPTREERDLLWRFRFSLVDNRQALSKFLLAVDWTVESEVVQAAELLEQWRKRSPMDVTDALKLLGKHVAFSTHLVRSYALDTLAEAPDSELRLYLLQLVQAIKYENHGNTLEGAASAAAASSAFAGSTDRPSSSTPSLAGFLIDRACHNIELANYLYWYLKVEMEDPTYGSRYREVLNSLEQALLRVPMKNEPKRKAAFTMSSIVDSVANKLGTSSSNSNNKQRADTTLSKSLSVFGEDGAASSSSSTYTRSVWGVLETQDEFISGVMDLQMKSRDARGKRDAKETSLREALAAEGFDRKLSGRPVPLPSAPHVRVDGLVSASAKMFKSALYPALIEFRVDSCVEQTTSGSPSTNSGGSRSNKKESKQQEEQLEESTSTLPTSPMTRYKVIMKTGDDLRQDQLVMMMIQLMDRLLKRGTLDLCLTPFTIIATSTSSGLVEFVDESSPISQVLANYNNSIMTYFKKHSPNPGAKYNVQPDVISTYIRSCAGYCVITYLLGVGDRHLDNILLQPDGHFFHIDFGFIFGRDPKPLPPAFRLTREMVEGMGGVDSTEYRQFCSLACQAYNTLRKSAGLCLNLLHLMGDAGIEDLSNNPSANTETVIASVEERFRLDLTDEQAERYFMGLIQDSLAALAPRVMDVFHSIAVARR